MNPGEAAMLLAMVAAYEDRPQAESTARAWAASLPDVTLADAMEWLPTHYRRITHQTRGRLMPGDVLAGVAAMQRERISSAHAVMREILQDPASEYRADPRYGAAASQIEAAKAANPLGAAAIEAERARSKPAGWEFGQR